MNLQLSSFQTKTNRIIISMRIYSELSDLLLIVDVCVLDGVVKCRTSYLVVVMILRHQIRLNAE